MVRELEAEAQKQYFGKIQALEDELQKTTAKLQELQKAQRRRGKARADHERPSSRPSSSASARRVAETRLALKEVRKNLRQDAEALVFWTKVANIALMPLLVALIGLLRRAAPQRRPGRMNARVAAILVVLLAVLGGAALVYAAARTARAGRQNAPALGQPLLQGPARRPTSPPIRIVEPKATLTLERKDDGWVIAERGGFPADFAKVREFVAQGGRA